MKAPRIAWNVCRNFFQYLLHRFKHSVFFALITLAITVACGTSIADDTELYTGLNNTPKILFVLDVSGSMGRNKDGFEKNRLERMKDALSELLKKIRGVDVGLMSFTAFGGRFDAVPEIDLLHPVANVEENQESLQLIVEGLQSGGWTPTVSALYEASLYLRGDAPFQGVAPNGESSYNSPVVEECQSGHIVVLTDGVPAGDTSIKNTLGGLNCDPHDTYTSATCGVELAKHLATEEQLPNLPGAHTITTHSIGFNLADTWIEEVAGAGGGLYRDAKSSEDLIKAFEDILDSVEVASSASAPSISVNAFNESRHRDELYYSFFQPYRTPQWEGNVKKYRLLNGDIVDANGTPVLDDDGFVSPTSQSFWSNSADGKNVADGGMAALQPAGRNWYTDAGVQPVNGITTPALVTQNDAVSVQAMGAADEGERDELVSWVRGFDPDNPTQAHHYVADSLHNSPTLVTYKAKESDDVLEEAIFSANNMGVLHAVRADTGEELWSYSAEELLPNIKKYFDNNSNSHIYGLDGNLVVHSEQKATSEFDFELEKASLYLTQRRGGNSIFALDITDAMEPTNPFQVMWKINGGIAGTDFRDLGQTWATPQLIPIRYGCPDACEVKDVLMFGGGYNPIYDDETLPFPVTPEPTGHGNAVYLVDPDTGALIWSAGNGAYHDLDLPMKDSIPTTPVPVDTNADGVVDVLFVSDLAGHVWRIDLRQRATTAAELAIGGGLIADLGLPGQALRFFNRVDVVISGTTQGTAFFNVVLGSGIRSSPLLVEPVDNRLFVIKDRWVFSYPKGEDVDANTGELLPRYTYVEKADGSRSVIRPADLWQHGTTESPNGLQFGYFRTFSARGEKILQPTLTHSGRIFVVSYVPPDPSTQVDLCNYDPGESRLHIFDLAEGSNELPPAIGIYSTVGKGIISIGTIVDTGDGSGADFVTGLNSQKLLDLLDPVTPNVFRKFIRTGWLEKDDQ